MTMDTPPEPTLFVWRAAERFWSHETPDEYRGFAVFCPFCGGVYRMKTYDSRRPKKDFKPVFSSIMPHYKEEKPDALITPDHQVIETIRCTRCGFLYETDLTSLTFGRCEESVTFAQLRELSVNDSSLGLNELGSHLIRRFGDAHYLSPRRFEELVADVFRNLGYSVRLTQQSRDGGFDIVLLERVSDEHILVECKRFSGTNRVGVSVVRQVLGVQLIQGIPKAKIVTTTYFTKPAVHETNQQNARCSGYELELIDADALVNALGVYNTELPPLHQHPMFVR